MSEYAPLKEWKVRVSSRGLGPARQYSVPVLAEGSNDVKPFGTFQFRGFQSVKQFASEFFGVECKQKGPRIDVQWAGFEGFWDKEPLELFAMFLQGIWMPGGLPVEGGAGQCSQCNEMHEGPIPKDTPFARYAALVLGVLTPDWHATAVLLSDFLIFDAIQGSAGFGEAFHILGAARDAIFQGEHHMNAQSERDVIRLCTIVHRRASYELRSTLGSIRKGEVDVSGYLGLRNRLVWLDLVGSRRYGMEVSTYLGRLDEAAYQGGLLTGLGTVKRWRTVASQRLEGDVSADVRRILTNGVAYLNRKIDELEQPPPAPEPELVSVQSPPPEEPVPSPSVVSDAVETTVPTVQAGEAEACLVAPDSNHEQAASGEVEAEVVADADPSGSAEPAAADRTEPQEEEQVAVQLEPVQQMPVDVQERNDVLVESGGVVEGARVDETLHDEPGGEQKGCATEEDLRVERAKINRGYLAIAVASGEGKTQLARVLPGLFLDHDDLLDQERHRELYERALNTGAWDELHSFQRDVVLMPGRVLLTFGPESVPEGVRYLGAYMLALPTGVRENHAHRSRLKLHEPVYCAGWTSLLERILSDVGAAGFQAPVRCVVALQRYADTDPPGYDGGTVDVAVDGRGDLLRVVLSSEQLCDEKALITQLVSDNPWLAESMSGATRLSVTCPLWRDVRNLPGDGGGGPSAPVDPGLVGDPGEPVISVAFVRGDGLPPEPGSGWARAADGVRGVVRRYAWLRSLAASRRSGWLFYPPDPPGYPPTVWRRGTRDLRSVYTAGLQRERYKLMLHLRVYGGAREFDMDDWYGDDFIGE